MGGKKPVGLGRSSADSLGWGVGVAKAANFIACVHRHAGQWIRPARSTRDLSSLSQAMGIREFAYAPASKVHSILVIFHSKRYRKRPWCRIARDERSIGRLHRLGSARVKYSSCRPVVQMTRGRRRRYLDRHTGTSTAAVWSRNRKKSGVHSIAYRCTGIFCVVVVGLKTQRALYSFSTPKHSDNDRQKGTYGQRTYCTTALFDTRGLCSRFRGLNRSSG